MLAPSLSLPMHQFFYTISLWIKDVLLWIMPAVVCLFIATTISNFKTRAPLFILIIITFEVFSNFSSVSFAYLTASLVSLISPDISPHEIKDTLTILWQFPFKRPDWWSAEKGSIIGVALGLAASYLNLKKMGDIIKFGKLRVEWFMTHVFARLIPIFILGFVAKIYATHMISYIIAHYLMLSVYLFIGLVTYLGILFLIGSRGILAKTLISIKNLLPATGIALTSCCSLTAIPWTIRGTEKNLARPELAQAIIPATTNIQQIGDCFANTFLCFLIYRAFYHVNPDIVIWLKFSLVFVLARFATAATMGGAIFLMIPIYEYYLGFNAEMIGLILAFNILLDPIITAGNVMGNGALCRLFEIIWVKFHKYPASPEII